MSLPFQVIETINESRAARDAKKEPLQGLLFDVYEGHEGETFEEGWKNKLIWGDNLLVMGSLLRGIQRDRILAGLGLPGHVPDKGSGWFPGCAGILPAWTIAGLRRVVHYAPSARAGGTPAFPGAPCASTWLECKDDGA